MSVSSPANLLKRWSVVDMEGMWVKMFDPPTDSPVTPDEVAPNNPVPEVLTAAGISRAPRTPHTMDINLMHGVSIETWDNRKKPLQFFLFDNPDINNTNGDDFPSPTLRMPRGVVFHCTTSGAGPAPHTIHWHGLEPSTINDGVGHCSMEIGSYTYQWQPQFIGSYFAHCHRNTVQHFEFGLYFLVLIEPSDAYFATQVLGVPIGRCRDGKRRIAANLTDFLQFPDFNANHLYTPDPWTGDSRLLFPTDPHAQTVAYDVEALWVHDDRDSVWSDLASNAKQTYPMHGDRPGINDNFHGHAGVPAAPADFFAFNDYNADYWFVTGVPVPTGKGGTATIPANLTVPDYLNSGVAGSQVSINALTGQTILVRSLNAAYNSVEITFPVDVVIIAWDGRALGVAPFGHNHAYLVPANTPIKKTTARRFDALIRETVPINSFVTVKFINNRGQVPGTPDDVVCTARIPFIIAANPGVATYALSGLIASEQGATVQGISVAVTPQDRGGSATEVVQTDVNGNYSLTGLVNGSYTVTPSKSGLSFTPAFTTVVINNNPQVANFIIDPEVRINNSNNNLLSLQAAYDAASSGDVIKLAAGTCGGGLIAGLSKTGIVIQGGYNPGFTSQVGTTVITGKVTISAGSVKMGGVVLR